MSTDFGEYRSRLLNKLKRKGTARNDDTYVSRRRRKVDVRTISRTNSSHESLRIIVSRSINHFPRINGSFREDRNYRQLNTRCRREIQFYNKYLLSSELITVKLTDLNWQLRCNMQFCIIMNAWLGRNDYKGKRY